MFEVFEKLFIGNERECFFDDREGWAVIHACKMPCHQRVLRYKGSLSQTHPHYLTFEAGNHLVLNIIDPSQPLFMLPLFTKSLEFIDKHILERNVLIHCNHGYSRAPSIALLWLAKRTEKVSDESYERAYIDFRELYPYYQPGRGITQYLSMNWNNID